MNVKRRFTFRNLLIGSLLCFLCAMVVALARPGDASNDELAEKRKHVVVRTIGDKLLKDANDFSTPVQALQELDEHTLRLHFQAPIAITPDSLSSIATTLISPDIAQRAIVQVKDVSSAAIVYAFEINHAEPVIIPCTDRILPESPYFVDISFYSGSTTFGRLGSFSLGLLISALVLLVLLGVYVWRNQSANKRVSDLRKSYSKTPLDKPENERLIQVRGIQLDLDNHRIICNQERIELTNKEAQVFGILLKNEGQLVSRSYLTEEVWLKEGVITSRSLDMYISRLRKKLKALPNAEIVNEHGKGYVLRV